MQQSTTTTPGGTHVSDTAARSADPPSRPAAGPAVRRPGAVRRELGAPRARRARPGAVGRAAPGPRRADRPVDRRRVDHRRRVGAAAVDPAAPAPGLGTVSNVFVVGLAMDGDARPRPRAARPRPSGSRCWSPGIVLNGVATGLYIAARFGPGPRDGLMTGLHRRHRPLDPADADGDRGGGRRRPASLLGGTVGVGTVLYALAIGPLAQLFLRVFAPPSAPVTVIRRPATVVATGPSGAGHTAAVTTALRHPYLDHPAPIAFAHRGGAADGLENTAAAFRRAVDGGLPLLRDRRAHHGGRPSRRLPRPDPGPGHRRPRAGSPTLPWSEVRQARVAGTRAAAPLRGAAGGVPRGPLERGRQGGAGAATRCST